MNVYAWNMWVLYVCEVWLLLPVRTYDFLHHDIIALEFIRKSYNIYMNTLHDTFTSLIINRRVCCSSGYQRFIAAYFASDNRLSYQIAAFQRTRRQFTCFTENIVECSISVVVCSLQRIRMQKDF